MYVYCVCKQILMKLGIWNFFGNVRPYMVNRTSILFSLLVLLYIKTFMQSVH